MSLSISDIDKNLDILTLFSEDKFPNVSNKAELVTKISELLNSHGIALGDYAVEEYKNRLEKLIGSMLDDTTFNAQKATQKFHQVVEKFADIAKNRGILNEISEENFPEVINKPDLIKKITQQLNTHDISLGYYTGKEYRNFFQTAIGFMLDDKKFNVQKADLIFPQIVAKFKEMDVKEKSRYASQYKEDSILERLRTDGYVNSNYWLTHTDIKQAFDHYLKNAFSIDPISLNHDQGETFVSAIEKNKDKPGKLLMPINLGAGHWVLVIRNQSEAGVDITCWDSRSHSDKEKKIVAFFKSVIDYAYDEELARNKNFKITASYKYGASQQDGNSCGYRVVRKAFEEAGVKNSLTEVLESNTGALCAEFVKLIANTDEALKKHELSIVEHNYAPLIYSRSHENQQHIEEVIKEKKKAQIEQDERLAIALQDVYRLNPEFSAEKAFQIAEREARFATRDELDKTKQKLINWIQQFYKNKQSPAPYKACRNDVNVADDGSIELNEMREDRLTPVG